MGLFRAQIGSIICQFMAKNAKETWIDLDFLSNFPFSPSAVLGRLLTNCSPLLITDYMMKTVVSYVI